MHLLYCDESNMEEKAGDFLLYGGVIVPAESSLALSNEISAIRKRGRIAATERVKFSPPPKGLSHAEYIEVKQAIIRAAVDHGAMFIAYAVLHDLSKGAETARCWGINTLCTHFNWILNRLGGPGLVLVDRVNNVGHPVDDLLREKVAIGVTGLPFGGEMKLANLVGYHYATIGQSHFTSLSDILVGSLRFAINAHCRNVDGNRASAIQIIQLINPLFFRERGGSKVPDLGLAFRPKSIKAPKYVELYGSLRAFLAEAGLETTKPWG